MTKPDAVKALVKELGSPDATTRIATMNQMLESCDAALREIAYERGFASAEQPIRALALRGKLRVAKILILEIAARQGDKGGETAVARWGSNIDMAVRGFDPQTGELKLAAGVSRVSGTNLTLNYGACRGPMQLQDGGILQGVVTCGPGNVTATIRL